MIKLLLFLSLVLAVALGVSYLADSPGTITMEWFGWQVDTTALFLCLAISLCLILLFLLFRLLTFLVTYPQRYRDKRKVQHYERGLTALTEAFSALAVSDLRTAKKLTKKADYLLGSPPITHLLSAQLARLEGDKAESVQQLTSLLSHKETEFLAARGLYEHARKSGDRAAATRYAELAVKISPASHLAALALIEQYMHAKRWQEAHLATQRGKKHQALTAEEAKRFEGLIDYHYADALAFREENEAALKYAKSAHKVLPAHAPATLLLMRLLMQTDHKRHISAVVARAWKAKPHPAIASLYQEMFTDEPSGKRLKRMLALESIQPQHPETHLAIAEAALDDRQWELARTHLNAAQEKQESPKLCRLMARLEMEQYANEERAAFWRKRAQHLHFAPRWECGDCKAVLAEWHLHCPECHGFDCVSWSEEALKFVPGAKLASPKDDVTGNKDDILP